MYCACFSFVISIIMAIYCKNEQFVLSCSYYMHGNVENLIIFGFWIQCSKSCNCLLYFFIYFQILENERWSVFSDIFTNGALEEMRIIQVPFLLMTFTHFKSIVLNNCRPVLPSSNVFSCFTRESSLAQNCHYIS